MVDDGVYISIGDLRQVLLEWFSLTDFRNIANLAAEDIVTMCFSKISGNNYPIGEKYETIRQVDETAIQKKEEETCDSQPS